MAFFNDLTVHSYSFNEHEPGVLNVGWLESPPITTGPTSAEFREKLKVLCDHPIHLHRGFHECDFCPRDESFDWGRIGNGQIRVMGQNGLWYAAPTMIYHYVTDHDYQPPQEFIDAVLNPRQIADMLQSYDVSYLKDSPFSCPECGAPVTEESQCKEQFHLLLMIEADFASSPRGITNDRLQMAHFYAVSSYMLQHPESMNCTAASLAQVRQNLADHLAGRATLAQVTNQVRIEFDGDHRVTRRSGEPVIRWPVVSWPLTVVDVIACDQMDYVNRVTHWARSVVKTLADQVGSIES